MSTTFWIIIAGAVATYLTRIGGHLVISRFDHIHPRVEAGLNAVKTARDTASDVTAPPAGSGERSESSAAEDARPRPGAI